MRPPIRFAHRNLVFGETARDAYAVYRLELESYGGLTNAQKIDLLATVAAFAYGLGADFSLLRVSRTWAVDEYVARAQAGLDRRHGDERRWQQYLESHREALARRGIARPELYISVRLAPPTRAAANQILSGAARLLSSPRHAAREFARATGAGDPRALSEHRLYELSSAEERVYTRIGEFFEAERVTTLDLQWLVRRAFCRGLSDPDLDLHWRPQALAIVEGDELSYRPLEADVLRLFDSPITVQERSLEIRSERGTSHQALCALGALPETVTFPGDSAELLFAPLDAVGFPVDAVLSAQFVPNDRATALVRRKVVDADNIFGEEARGDHGPSSDSARRPHAARALEDYLTGEGRPPLLKCSIGFAVGAASADELDQRLDRLKTEYGTVALHRPLGDQLRLFCEHFPGQTIRVSDYADYLTLEQLGALMPVATHAVGSGSGPYLGYTLSGSRQPVLFDLKEASRTSRPPSVLLCGTLGSGKTMTLQKLLYECFLLGSRLVDIDPKGDHNLHLLPGLKGAVETIDLRSDTAYRGLLDPLRIAPEGTAEDFATSFLIDVLPHPIPPTWRTEIRRAVKTVVTTAEAEGQAGNCCRVIEELARGDDDSCEVARALAVYSDTGLAQLGFGDDGQPTQTIGSKPVTSLRIRNLARPLPGTPKDDLSEEERIGQAILRLLAGYAMHLMGSDRSRHKVLGFDEAWFLLQDAAGRRLIEHLNRWGRSENATPLLVTHLVSDAEEVDNLIGARLVFGLESEQEAAAALRLLRLDPDDERLRRRLLSYRRGRALMRDLDGRVGAIQVDPGDELLATLDTTPGEPAEARAAGPAPDATA